MSGATLAVLIPSYNHARYIGEALRSVLQQTRPPHEIHVIDDGSSDDSVAVIEQAFKEAVGIRCTLKVRSNRGISATRNELAATAHTDFIAFLDSDDVYAPTRLERMMDQADSGGLYFGISGVAFDSNTDHKLLDAWRMTYRFMLGQAMAFPTAGFALLRSNFAISTSNFVMSRRLFEAVGGFDPQIAICQDWDFAIRALRLVEPVFVPETLLSYRLHGDNTSYNARESADWEIDVVLEKLRDWVLQSSPNTLAPTPWNWPRFFKVFVYLCSSIGGRPVAARIPPDILAGTQPDTMPERDARAIRELVTAARDPEMIMNLSIDELMTRCQRAWMRCP